jgi:phosphoribosyl-dephospho-CoA transferase
MTWKRHTLVDITDAGRLAALADHANDEGGLRVTSDQAAQVLLAERAGARIPGIVRRPDRTIPAACVPVGFCSPWVGPEGRLRIAAVVSREEVSRVTSPYALLLAPLPERTPCLRVLAVVHRLAGRLGLALGVWGSAALEIYTGLPYTHQGSDLDLLVAPAPRKVLACFLGEIRALEERYALRVDVELDLPAGYGVQLKELFGEGRMVIGKSFVDVALLPRARVLSQLPGHTGAAVADIVVN